MNLLNNELHILSHKHNKLYIANLLAIKHKSKQITIIGFNEYVTLC